MKKLLFVFCGMLLSTLCPSSLAGQEVKYEREFRMDVQEVPAAAREFVEACAVSDKVRWYGEESQDGYSVEAKTTIEGYRYSIEFDSLGHIQDVEVENKWKYLPDSTRVAMESHLCNSYERYRIRKVQVQWVAPRDVLIDMIRTGRLEADYQPKYEVVVKGRKESGTVWHEYLFDQSGNFIRRSRIEFRNIDNLEY